MLDQDEQENNPTVQQQYEIKATIAEPVLYTASSNPDIMYLQVTMKAPDCKQFLSAMDKEIQGHEQGKHWELIPKVKVPKGMKILDAVWSMKGKRKIETHKIYKWKAQLNMHGGQQVHGINYWDTYTPVVAWPLIQFFFILLIMLHWKTWQIDFILAFPQVPIQTPLYMNIPEG